MQKIIQYNFIFISMVILVSVVPIQSTSAQTKLYDLYEGSVSVAFSPDGKYIATGDSDGDVGLWDVSSGENVYYRSLGGEVQGVAFSPDGKYIAADGAGGGVRIILIEASGAREIERLDLVDEAHQIHSVAYSPDGRHVAIGDDTGRAYLWNVNNDRLFWWTYWQDELYSVAFSPNGEYLATGDSDGYVRLWEVNTWWGDPDDLNVQSVELGGNVRAVAFSPNGRYLAADGYDGINTSVIIYDVVSGRSVQQIDPDVYEVNALAFSPDGQYLAVGGTDPEIIIYRIGTEVITVVTAITRETTIQASGEVFDLAWSPDGDLISDGRAVYQTPAASLPKIVFQSQEIDDSATLVGSWSRGNSNGVIEAGERIEFKVTLKNDGVDTANNVQGILLTEDSSIQIFDSSMDYSDIRPGSFSAGPPPFPVRDFSEYSFKIEVQNNAAAHDVICTLKVTADNGGPWYIPIKLSIVDSSEIRLVLPNDLISAEAFGTNSTYFVLRAKYPTLTGISEAEVSYGSCTITLHIPSNTQAFIFPIKTKEDKAIDAGVNAIISLGLSTVPWASTLKDLINFYLKIFDAVNQDFDLKIDLQNLDLDPKRPEIEIEYVVLLKNEVSSLNGINLTIEQEYRLGDGDDTIKVHQKKFWNFGEGWAAPAGQPVVLSDYSPFQLLPLEVQDSLLHHFSTEKWRIPEEMSLLPNYPNPFNPETWIPYQLSKPADVTVFIYSVDGKLVRMLDLGHQLAGIYQSRSRAAYWDGKNALGEPVASGLYFYTFTASDFTATRKMLIRK